MWVLRDANLPVGVGIAMFATNVETWKPLLLSLVLGTRMLVHVCCS